MKYDNNIPIYIQLVEELKKNIISGRILPGERLPSVRDFAIEMKVNPNTMQKALQELESINLIYTERTNGKYVTTDKKLIDKYRKEFALSLSNKYFTDMESIGFTKEEIVEYLKLKGGIK
jgi:DNA-binding transcriptional regulator YhcF (GntR family)